MWENFGKILEVVMVAPLEIEKLIVPSQQTIEIGKITLMLPIEVVL
jgi:hypothetical protein